MKRSVYSRKRSNVSLKDITVHVNTTRQQKALAQTHFDDVVVISSDDDHGNNYDDVKDVDDGQFRHHSQPNLPSSLPPDTTNHEKKFSSCVSSPRKHAVHYSKQQLDSFDLATLGESQSDFPFMETHDPTIPPPLRNAPPKRAGKFSIQSSHPKRPCINSGLNFSFRQTHSQDIESNLSPSSLPEAKLKFLTKTKKTLSTPRQRSGITSLLSSVNPNFSESDVPPPTQHLDSTDINQYENALTQDQKQAVQTNDNIIDKAFHGPKTNQSVDIIITSAKLRQRNQKTQAAFTPLMSAGAQISKNSSLLLPDQYQSSQDFPSTELGESQMLLEDIQYILDGVFTSVPGQQMQSHSQPHPEQLFRHTNKMNMVAFADLLLSPKTLDTLNELDQTTSIFTQFMNILIKQQQKMTDLELNLSTLLVLFVCSLYSSQIHLFSKDHFKLIVTVVQKHFKLLGNTKAISPHSNNSLEIHPQICERVVQVLEKLHTMTMGLKPTDDDVLGLHSTNINFSNLLRSFQTSKSAAPIGLALVLAIVEKYNDVEELVLDTGTLNVIMGILALYAPVPIAGSDVRSHINHDTHILSTAFHVLEYTSLTPSLQQYILKRFPSITQLMLNTIGRFPSEFNDEACIVAALKLMLNLLHDYDNGLVPFCSRHGVSTIANLLWRETFIPSASNFDVRIVSMVILVTVVAKNPVTKAGLLTLEFSNHHENNGTMIVDEQQPSSNQKETKPMSFLHLILTILSKMRSDESDSNRDPQDMEKKISIGYLTLLLGSLAIDSEANRRSILEGLQMKSLSTLADVLEEFLEFNHEVGISSSLMDSIYAQIIDFLKREIHA